MSNIIQKTDYSTDLDLFLAQYANSTKLKGLVDSTYDQADDIEQALFEIRDEFWLSTAAGDQLDIIGSIFDETRNGDADATYRIRIESKAGLNASGEPEKIIEALKTLFGATFVTYIPGWPSQPASFYIITDAVITIVQLIRYCPAGVQPYIIESLKYEDDDPIELQDGNYLYANKQ